jgi:hypothetical protein
MFNSINPHVLLTQHYEGLSARPKEKKININGSSCVCKSFTYFLFYSGFMATRARASRDARALREAFQHYVHYEQEEAKGDPELKKAEYLTKMILVLSERGSSKHRDIAAMLASACTADAKAFETRSPIHARFIRFLKHYALQRTLSIPEVHRMMGVAEMNNEFHDLGPAASKDKFSFFSKTMHVWSTWDEAQRFTFLRREAWRSCSDAWYRLFVGGFLRDVITHSGVSVANRYLSNIATTVSCYNPTSSLQFAMDLCSFVSTHIVELFDNCDSFFRRGIERAITYDNADDIVEFLKCHVYFRDKWNSLSSTWVETCHVGECLFKKIAEEVLSHSSQPGMFSSVAKKPLMIDLTCEIVSLLAEYGPNVLNPWIKKYKWRFIPPKHSSLVPMAQAIAQRVPWVCHALIWNLTGAGMRQEYMESLRYLNNLAVVNTYLFSALYIRNIEFVSHRWMLKVLQQYTPDDGPDVELTFYSLGILLCQWKWDATQLSQEERSNYEDLVKEWINFAHARSFVFASFYDGMYVLFFKKVKLFLSGHYGNSILLSVCMRTQLICAYFLIHYKTWLVDDKSARWLKLTLGA